MRVALAILLIPFSAPAQAPNASLTGTVVDITGAFIPKAAVELDSGTKKYRGQADDAGVYRFSNLPSGEYTLTLEVPPSFQKLTIPSIGLANGEQKRMPDVSLVISPDCGGPPGPDFVRLLPGGTTFGTLSGSVGVAGSPTTPLADVEVTLICRTFSGCKSTKTDSEGRFSFGTLSEGEYGLSFKHEGFYPVSATRYEYQVKGGLEYVYGPALLDHCTTANCDPKLQPQRPIPAPSIVCGIADN